MIRNSIILICFLLVISGCSTTNKYTELNTRVLDLENRLVEIEKSQGQPVSNEADFTDYKESSIAPSVLTKKDIQKALKSAGFYNGKIDGVLGKESRRAIREFQTANGLSPDGIAGKETKARLSKYLTQ